VGCVAFALAPISEDFLVIARSLHCCFATNGKLIASPVCQYLAHWRYILLLAINRPDEKMVWGFSIKSEIFFWRMLVHLFQSFYRQYRESTGITKNILQFLW